MKYIHIFFICFTAEYLLGQTNPVFQFEGKQLHLIDMTTLSFPVWHDDTLSANDNEHIRLFKSYFKPISYLAYKNFFLPAEWPGISLEEYQQWQKTISIKRLLLQNIIHVREITGQEYLIFQYMMDGPAYAVFQSAEFKKTASGWKHFNQHNDQYYNCLLQISVIEIPKLQEMIKGTSRLINIESIPYNETRTYKEKFDRKDLYNLLETLLERKGVAKEDRNQALTYFEYKDDVAFIESICSKYNLDDIEFMKEINEAAGMEIYQFSRVQND